MITKKLFKTLGLATVLSIATSSIAVAYITPTDLPTCYLSVHDQCYGNGETNCTDDVYQTGLGWCDDIDWGTKQAIGGAQVKKAIKTIQKQRASKLQRTR